MVRVRPAMPPPMMARSKGFGGGEEAIEEGSGVSIENRETCWHGEDTGELKGSLGRYRPWLGLERIEVP